MKQNGILKDFEDKKTKAGDRYTRFKINDEWYSCFDKKVSEELKKHEGKNITVELKVAGNFKNIKAISDDPVESDEAEVQVEQHSSTGNQGASTDRVDRAKALEIASQFYEQVTPEYWETANLLFNFITKGE
jgi:hypothetical protein